MQTAITLWKFSRPHTIIGSVISITTLFLMAAGSLAAAHLPLLLTALIIGISCNIFIVGINQIADVEIDRINKPFLPIPAGLLNLKQAKIIVYSSLLLSLLLAFYLSPYLFLIILISTGIGWAYSMPPFFLKKHHLPAALAITIVRGIMVNVGGFLVFNSLINGQNTMPENMKILTVFIVVFSIVIAWFKDLPDIEGDAKYNIRTLAILYSPKFTLLMGNVLIGAAYLLTITLKLLEFRNTPAPSFTCQSLLYGHIILFGLFLWNSFYISLAEQESVKRFYKRFWWFFFAEYLLYLLSYISL